MRTQPSLPSGVPVRKPDTPYGDKAHGQAHGQVELRQRARNPAGCRSASSFDPFPQPQRGLARIDTEFPLDRLRVRGKPCTRGQYVSL